VFRRVLVIAGLDPAIHDGIDEDCGWTAFTRGKASWTAGSSPGTTVGKL
jgi:hypothetical protein